MINMAYQFKASNLILNEFDIVKDIVEGEGQHIDLYSTYIPRLVNRLERYYQMINLQGNLLENIVKVLDKYNLVYSTKVIMDTLDKSKTHDFIPLRQIDAEVKIYKEEVEAIKKIEKFATRQLMFALLVVSKLRTVRYADPTIHLCNVIDVSRLCGKAKVKQEVYFCLHELVQKELVTVPLIENTLTVNLTRCEGEVEYVLENTDVLDLTTLFNNLIGEYRAENQMTILEISLVENYHEVHNSMDETIRKHNERSEKRIGEKSVKSCLAKNSMSTGNSAFIQLDEDEVTDEEYIKRLCDFFRFQVKPNATKAKKLGWEWHITRELLCAKCSDEIVMREGELGRRERRMKMCS